MAPLFTGPSSKLRATSPGTWQLLRMVPARAPTPWAVKVKGQLPAAALWETEAEAVRVRVPVELPVPLPEGVAEEEEEARRLPVWD